MNENLQMLLDAIAEASTHAHILRYLPNLQNVNPAQCLLIYVTKPKGPEVGEVSEYVTVETPVELAMRMMGGLSQEEIIGIFPLHEAVEAICLAEFLVEQAQSQA